MTDVPLCSIAVAEQLAAADLEALELALQADFCRLQQPTKRLFGVDDTFVLLVAGVVTDRQQYSVQYFREVLPDDIELEMVSIPAGEFLMGSPEGEGSENEKPQHFVIVPAFFMGKYPVTQEQWRLIALQKELQVARKLNSEPSHFSGYNKPVQGISWHDAVEFCARLSKMTDKNYRLPSEAEWEYACRAGTNTPFCFGATLTTELANYNSNYIYASGQQRFEPQGLWRELTTPVNQFIPNAFGLYDVHGNVSEWCADNRHSNYREAPKDGSAWVDYEKAKNSMNVLRGGSWLFDPNNCRSASRHWHYPVDRLGGYGFRVVCEAARNV
jgi:formylglycine-generating enzyme required for sulfatase activity